LRLVIRIPVGLSPNRQLIWSDLVNSRESVGLFFVFVFQGHGQLQPWQV
jgi:hypothetical protein